MQGGCVHVHMQIAQMQNPKALKGCRQVRDHYRMMAKVDTAGIPFATLVEAGEPQASSNDTVDGIPVFEVEQVATKAKDLRCMILLYAYPLPGMNLAQTLLKARHQFRGERRAVFHRVSGQEDDRVSTIALSSSARQPLADGGILYTEESMVG